MQLVFSIVYFLLLLYLVVLIGRLVLDWVQVFSRDWRPKGVLLVLAELVYTLTDPPLNWLRRYIPPLRLGPVALDLGFIILFLGVSISMQVAASLSLP
ncbi:YggT family protein [Georgenia satyanarayanai]|uniref:YggT family protein n=1 Tax=Georgenia satyanarayanai TaxID=860221 RepID=A0A2Y9AB27_9MICO|nr:YggT family protein [Georgenia satyanarayanai]PYF99822.1 YggT family protein [Georgenia satyanarayanai]SSA41804.1 YggT family protein [Georgenia satyanarayanai]